MAMIVDSLVGAAVGELMKVVIDMKDRAVKYKPSLEQLETTLQSIGPLINEIDGLNRRLDRPENETKKLISHMKSGKELVLKCSEKVKWWNCCYKAKYQEEMEELDEEIRRFFELDLRAQDARNVLETLVVATEIQAELRDVAVSVKTQRNERVELRGVCSPPQPPGFIVGFDVPLNELKLRLLRDEVTVSVVMVTGSGGSGKSTLAKTFCWDQHVKDKFKENIFFVTFTKTPKLSTIVQKLYQHTGYKVPEFQGDEDAFNQLENLLKKIGNDGPILLVLDDVWLGSESLIDNFVFQIPNYKILVMSKFAIGRFGTPYVLKPLAEPDAINLLQHSASLNERVSDDIPHDVVKEIAKRCGGSPLALRVSGRSLSHQEQVVWLNRARNLSKGRRFLDLDSSTKVLSCLEESLDVLDSKAIECFRDLSLFPEDQRIPATALLDMWAELYNEDDASLMEIIFELVNRNMVDIFVTRKVASDTIDYNYHYVAQYGLLRELAIRHTSQEPEDQRNKLIIDLTGNNLPSWWTLQNEYHIAARILSISVDETFTSEWCNLLPPEVEALVLNIKGNKCTLPMFMKKMNKLKVLIITNHDFFYHAILENFEVLDDLPNLKKIRLEKVTIPSLSKSWLQMKNLQKCSFFMCNVNEAFENSTIQDSEVLPKLIELNFDYCNMVEFPAILSTIVSLEKLRITNCHKLSSLPEGIGGLINLESLRLSSCTDLSELPDSITTLHNLKFLDISNCTSLEKLPENIGELGKLEKLNVKGCSMINDMELPSSVMDLKGLKHVVCDEEAASYWEPYTSILSDLRVEIVQAEFRLDFLNSLH